MIFRIGIKIIVVTQWVKRYFDLLKFIRGHLQLLGIRGNDQRPIASETNFKENFPVL